MERRSSLANGMTTKLTKMERWSILSDARNVGKCFMRPKIMTDEL